MNVVKHFIDCDSGPKIPDGWIGFKNHVKGGQFEWDLARVALYFSKKQKTGIITNADELQQEIVCDRLLNANILDYLTAHPELIPDDWKDKDKMVFFLGTTYLFSDGRECFRYLHCNKAGLGWGFRYHDDGLGSSSPVAVLAS